MVERAERIVKREVKIKPDGTIIISSSASGQERIGPSRTPSQKAKIDLAASAFIQFISGAVRFPPECVSSEAGWLVDSVITGVPDPEKAARELRAAGISAREASLIALDMAQIRGVEISNAQRDLCIKELETKIKEIYNSTTCSPARKKR